VLKSKAKNPRSAWASNKNVGKSKATVGLVAGAAAVGPAAIIGILMMGMMGTPVPGVPG